MKKFIEDLYSMIVFLKHKGTMTDSEILYNILHDLSGFLKNEKGFVPRCDGYSEKKLIEDFRERR